MWKRALLVLGVAALLAASGCSGGPFSRGGGASPTPSGSATGPAPTTGPSTTPAVLVDIPDLHGDGLAQARQRLTDLGLKATVVTVADGRQPDGTIVDSTPEAGSRIRPGTTVTLHEAVTIVAVPDVRGMTAEQADRTLRDLGLQPVFLEAANTDPARDGRVLSEHPDRGQQVRHGSQVTVRYYAIIAPPSPSPSPTQASPTAAPTHASPRVSPTHRSPTAAPTSASPAPRPPSPSPSRVLPSPTHKDLAIIPGIVGESLTSAEAKLQAAGLSYEQITVDRPDVPAGTVIAVAPPAGDEVAPGSSVTLRVAVNLVEIPDLTGENFALATRTLAGLGLAVIGKRLENSDPDRSGEVAKQKPAAGKKVPRGSQVVVEYYAKADVSPSPDPSDSPVDPADGD
ncbi:MAG: PASTA domain-containing protein [Hamadaea sp.]|nr:PASTA domain-containing protein [Hamadaea sp.]